jgi:hypothetical protein
MVCYLEVSEANEPTASKGSNMRNLNTVYLVANAIILLEWMGSGPVVHALFGLLCVALMTAAVAILLAIPYCLVTMGRKSA